MRYKISFYHITKSIDKQKIGDDKGKVLNDMGKCQPCRLEKIPMPDKTNPDSRIKMCQLLCMTLNAKSMFSLFGNARLRYLCKVWCVKIYKMV